MKNASIHLELVGFKLLSIKKLSFWYERETLENMQIFWDYFCFAEYTEQTVRTIPSRYPLIILKHSFNDMLITHELSNKERKCFVFSN